MHVQALAIYPVKGLRGHALASARVERCGLAGDRRWAIARPDGRAYTQRDLPGMARIEARLEGATLRLEATGHGGVDARPEPGATRVDIWRTDVPAVQATPAASDWLTRVLGTPCTLVHLADPNARHLTPDLARPGDVVSLADGFPLLVTTTASLADLNSRLANPVPMDRFRPNLVIDGAMPWAEDGWAQLQAGAVRLRLASRCARCRVITLDQATGEPPDRTEPLRTLGLFHRDAEMRITFGMNAVPEPEAGRLGTLQVGDPVNGRSPEAAPFPRS